MKVCILVKINIFIKALDMKTITKMSLITLIGLIKITKILFSKNIGFLCNFIIYIIPVANAYNYTVNRWNIGSVLFSLALYPIIFELTYKYYLKKRISEAHQLADKIIVDIKGECENQQKKSTSDF